MYTSACDCVFEPSRTIAWSVVFCTSTYQRYRHLTVADQAVSTWYIIRGATSALMMCCGIQSGTATSIAPTMRQQYSSSICCATIARCCVLPLVPHPICYLRPSFTYVLPPSSVVITQIRGHIAGYPPPPLRYSSCIFIARRVQHFLPSSTRVELGLPTLGGQ